MDFKAVIRNSLHFGVGAISSTREKVEEIVAELVKKGDLTRVEGVRFADEVTRSIDKAKKEIDNQVQKGTRKAAEALNLVTQDDLKKLDRKISRLRSDMKKMSGASAGKTKKTR